MSEVTLFIYRRSVKDVERGGLRSGVEIKAAEVAGRKLKFPSLLLPDKLPIWNMLIMKTDLGSCLVQSISEIYADLKLLIPDVGNSEPSNGESDVTMYRSRVTSRHRAMTERCGEGTRREVVVMGNTRCYKNAVALRQRHLFHFSVTYFIF